MKRVLLIVDPQNDFITGTLAVEGAKKKMMELAEYVKHCGDSYDYICVTLDSHPENHCSFTENGGIWPKHCVEYSNGWQLPEYLRAALAETSKATVEVYFKGTESDQEEYSIFDNDDDGYDLRVLLEELDIQEGLRIDVCGIAGDYCVLETLKGLYQLFDNVWVLQQYTASIDKGNKLNEYLDAKHINSVLEDVDF